MDDEWDELTRLVQQHRALTSDVPAREQMRERRLQAVVDDTLAKVEAATPRYVDPLDRVYDDLEAQFGVSFRGR
jgi:hypothetical protein